MGLIRSSFGSSAGVAAAVLLVARGMESGAFGQSATVINPGTSAWVQAARTSRADMFVIGDSVTWYAGDGWDAGFINAGKQTLGLAGTGLIVNSQWTPDGDGYSLYGAWNGWDETLSLVPANLKGHAVRAQVVAADATPHGTFGYGIWNNSTLNPNVAYDWHLWTASPAGGGTMGAYTRANFYPFTHQVEIANIQNPATSTALAHSVLNIPAVSAPAGQGREIFLKDVTNTSIFYSRLLAPGAKGVTVTSWGYGGHSTYDFYNDQYTGLMSNEGRAAYLKAMVDGGSGKLNVVIAEGFNDRAETSASLKGTLPGNSPQAFTDNMSSLIGRIRADWALGGNSPGNLSFTLLGMYNIEAGPYFLYDYADRLRGMATADPQISFVNLGQLTPSFEQAQAQGFFADGIHLNRAGALNYSRVVMDSLVAKGWNVDASGDWTAPGNWESGAIPNAVNAAANFGGVISAERTVSVSAPQTVGRIGFDSANGYVLSGSGALTLASAGGSAIIDDSRGSHTISTPVIATSDLTIAVAGATSTLTLSGDLNVARKIVRKSGLGMVEVKNFREGALVIEQGTVRIIAGQGDAGTSVFPTMPSIPTGGRFDVNDGHLIVNEAWNVPVQTIRELMQAGRGGEGLGGGPWDAYGGIASSAAAAGDGISTALGYVYNSTLPELGLPSYTSFGGQTVDDWAILIRYTLGADANLDGKVNTDDVTILGAMYKNAESGHWFLGDFDYDGMCDTDDVTVLGALYDPTAAPMSAAQLSAQFGNEFAAAFERGRMLGASVPEPGMGILVGLGGAGALAVRRRRCGRGSR